MYGLKILKWSIRSNLRVSTRKSSFCSSYTAKHCHKNFFSPFLTRGYREKAIIFNPRFDYFLVLESMTNWVSDLSKEVEELTEPRFVILLQTRRL